MARTNGVVACPSPSLANPNPVGFAAKASRCRKYSRGRPIGAAPEGRAGEGGAAQAVPLSTSWKLRPVSGVIEEVKGDRVEIVIDAGGSTLSYEVVATRAGRRVDVSHGRGIVEVTELTRGGTPVRTARFMASRVLALVEHPASRTAEPDDAG